MIQDINPIQTSLPTGTTKMMADSARVLTPEFKARQAAEEFEAFFLARYLDAMQMGLETDGPMGGGQGEEMFRGVLNDEYAKVISSRGGIGIADTVYREILSIQEQGQES
jgi:Rod binding domain-containing protein